MNRLWQQLKLVAAGTGTFQNFQRSGLPAEEDDARRRTVAADRNRRFHTVEMRHGNIAQHGLRLQIARDFNGLAPTVSGVGLETVAVQYLNDGVGDKGFIIDNQHKLDRKSVV